MYSESIKPYFCAEANPEINKTRTEIKTVFFMALNFKIVNFQTTALFKYYAKIKSSELLTYHEMKLALVGIALPGYLVETISPVDTHQTEHGKEYSDTDPC